MGLRLSMRARLATFDLRTMDVALSAACKQESEMELYLAEKKARLEMLPEPFQRQKRKMKKLMKRQQPTMVLIESTFQSVVLAGNEKPVCVHCGKRHGEDVCWTRLGRCLKCGSKNHRIKDCPNQKKRFVP